MTGPGMSTLFVGTRQGLLRWQGGQVTPLGGNEGVTALALAPGGRVLAARRDGRLERFGPEGEVEESSLAPEQDPIVSLLCMNGGGRVVKLLAGTKSGRLLESDDLGSTLHDTPSRSLDLDVPVHVVAVPGRARMALVIAAGCGGWLLDESRATLEPWFGGPAAAIVEAVPHPTEAHLWIARTAERIVRSSDGGRTFRPIAGWREDSIPRTLHFTTLPNATAFVLTHPSAEPPDPSDPSPLLQSRDGGQTFHPIPSRRIDRARDPSGELTALSSWRDRDPDVLLLGTDRGELLEWRGGDRAATLLAADLPPIEHLLAAPARVPIDPSSSGIHLLP